MHVEILTPRKIEFHGEADDVILPTILGEIGVLSYHAPLISVLKPGRIKIRKGKEEIVIQADGGVLQVSKNSATILLKNFHVQ